MPNDVRAALVEVVMTHGQMTATAAERFVRDMELAGRYRVECWS